MSARKLFVGGNWKSNLTLKQGKELIANVYNNSKVNYKRMDVLAAPIYPHLSAIKEVARKEVIVAAQNLSKFGFGAYTGEVTVEHLKDLGLSWTLLGHSERRHIYGESDKDVAEKTKRCQDLGVNVVLCIGELLEERKANRTKEVNERQLEACFGSIKDWSKIVIAYEPVWAIGTGVTATTQQAQEVHAVVRSLLSAKVGKEIAEKTRIIYGGSANAKNAGELINCPDVDGFLVGGAALKPEFDTILTIVSKKASSWVAKWKTK